MAAGDRDDRRGAGRSSTAAGPSTRYPANAVRLRTVQNGRRRRPLATAVTSLTPRSAPGLNPVRRAERVNDSHTRSSTSRRRACGRSGSRSASRACSSGSSSASPVLVVGGDHRASSSAWLWVRDLVDDAPRCGAAERRGCGGGGARGRSPRCADVRPLHLPLARRRSGSAPSSARWSPSRCSASWCCPSFESDDRAARSTSGRSRTSPRAST